MGGYTTTTKEERAMGNWGAQTRMTELRLREEAWTPSLRDCEICSGKKSSSTIRNEIEASITKKQKEVDEGAAMEVKLGNDRPRTK